MSSEWPTVRLGDLASKITKGTTPKSFISGAGPDRINFIKVETISQDGRLIPSKFAYIDAATNAILSRSVVQEDDLLFTIAGTIGRVARVRQHHLPANTNQAVAIVRANKSLVDIGYLSCVLGDRVRVQQAQSRVVQSVQANFSLAELADLEIPLPPLNEQRRIAGVLGALDELIEVNRRLIRDLDDLGLLSLLAALPRGSAEVDGSDETDGWEYTTLADASSVLETGSRPKGGVAAIRRGVPSVGAESIDGLARFNFSKVKFVSEEFFAGMKRGHVASGDVLVYKDGGTPGSFTPKVGMFGEGFPFGRMSINEHVFRVRVNSPISNAYLYFWLRTERMMSEMHRAGTGAAIPGINKTAFGCLPIVIPPAETAQPLCASLENICTAALQIANEIRQLEETRDELLPLLMSGRVRVAEEVAA